MAFYNRLICSLPSKWASGDASSHPNRTSVVPGKFVVRCHTRSSNPSFSSTMGSDIDLKSKFMQVYDSIKSDLLHDPAFEFDDDSRQWVERMIDYNVPGGKMTRGLSVVDSYKLLKGELELTDDELFLACALGWCIEWMQGYILLHDDIMDGFHKRRGQPCWFRLPEVNMIAVNDGALLANHVRRILKKNFHGKAYYAHLLELFNEAEFQMVYGQTIDVITTQLLERKISQNIPCFLIGRIIRYKCSYYSFYLPVACAFLMLGENPDDYVKMKDILVEMGIYYQIQDDYLDTFGDHNTVGKIGTDIEDFKCSWLVAKALELASQEQKKILYENYGKKDQACVAKVKELYHTLNLQGAYEEYEKKTHEEFMNLIESHPSNVVQAVLKTFMGKIYKRQK